MPDLEFLDGEMIERLSKKITEEYYKFDKTALKRWGIEGKEKIIYSTKQTLKRLRTCVELDDAERFCSYMDWLTTVMTSRKIKFDVVFNHTEICCQICSFYENRFRASSKQCSASQK
ncbi:MAG: hypothetical protein OEM28_11915 [Nitrosopumilus sp.]|nr:hypothetical protein [Nitrosopumilus sp.]MDH3487158.1 hypothetical protein [Nitrosopumilus sp.]